MESGKGKIMYNKNDPETIQAMFNSIAKTYDKTNAIMSLHMHKLWNNALINKVLIAEKPEILLDVCCGTGAISLKYLERTLKPTKAYLLDFSETMLQCAKAAANSKQLEAHDIQYMQADATAIPLKDDSVDSVTIAYGVRNIKEPSSCIEEMYRVLKPKKPLGILELTEPDNALLRLGHRYYLKTILPLVGKMTTSNKEAYQYLCQSIHSFISRETLVKSLRKAGFKNIKTKKFLGGIATLFTATK